MVWHTPYPDWKPNPPYEVGDYFLGHRLGYDHSFTPFGYKTEFRKMPAVQKFCPTPVINSIKRLPHNKLILPELLVHTRWFPLEPMLCALMERAWGRSASWKVYSRLLLVRRIKAGEELLQSFSQTVPGVEQAILYGCNRKERKQLLKLIHEISILEMQNPTAHGVARFLGSCLQEDPTLSLIRPYHWLRAAYITADPVVVLGMGEAQKEMRGQKEDLVDLMKSKLSKRMIEDLS